MPPAPAACSLHDLIRDGRNVAIACRCGHRGVADGWALATWARLWRWPSARTDAIGAHFRCTRCGARGATLAATDAAATVLAAFPADEAGWKRLRRRLRD